jgi:hypothetical protein
MGVLSDFFIATDDEAQSFDASSSPVNAFPTFQARRIDVVKLVLLQCAIDGSTFEAHLDLLDTLFLRSESDDGPWVLIVPIDIQKALASADDYQLDQYGIAWASTEEWISDGGKPGEVIACLKDLARLAKQAEKENRNIYLWVAL